MTVRYILESLDGGTNWIGNMVGGGGAALTIEDEGTPLATAATTLDFVGAGVTASGTGAEKTITIPGTTVAEIVAAVGDRHVHVVDEQFNGDASTTVFTLANSAWPDSVMGWVAGVRTPVTLGGSMFDQVTFGSAPGSGTNNVSIDYAAVVV